ncbi:hypothetical protein BpHYR1_025323 [Brachionus plicatilis]|uniref:Uncharacterized protein n=1 Tax=Brachionus plicatilis TaxID=10195 RepID=A0A3M7Q933_BRAPC|nr:hypothetical protein BpHYR1_025323 [Brachionus plicatilis]
MGSGVNSAFSHLYSNRAIFYNFTCYLEGFFIRCISLIVLLLTVVDYTDFQRFIAIQNFASRWVPPAPGIMASFVSTRPILADEDATRISQANAISSPPPSATPSIAAIIGTVLETKGPTSSCCIFALSFKSAPAQKTPGTKLRIITHRAFLS